MKTIILVLLVGLLVGFSGKYSKAEAPIIIVKNIIKDERADRLKIFLKKYNSPLQEYSHDFIETADIFRIDYTILISISGVESTFGTHYLCGRNNPFGYGNPCWNFGSFREAIRQVGKTIGSSRYYNRFQETGRVSDLAGTYNPAYALDWTNKIKYFQNEINKLE